MKLLIVTCINEHCSIVLSVLAQAQISVFSKTDTIGHKNSIPINLSDNWFGKTGEEFDSSVYFSFTEDDKAQKTILLINTQNSQMQLNFPIHAFVMPVEYSTT